MTKRKKSKPTKRSFAISASISITDVLGGWALNKLPYNTLRMIVRSKKYSHDDLSELFRSHLLDGIELVVRRSTTYEDLTRVKEFLEAYNIKTCSVHQPLTTVYSMSLRQVENLAAMAYYLNAPIIVIHLSAFGNSILKKSFQEGLLDIEKKYKITICLENSPKDITVYFKRRYYDPRLFTRIVDKTPFGITFDTTHLGHAGGDILHFFEQNKHKIKNIHLSDYRSTVMSMHIVPGMGKLPLRDLLLKLQEEHYPGLVTIEVQGKIEDIKKSLRFLHE